MPDMWTAMQFDAAVSYFGVYIENRLNELDDKGKPVYLLADLLRDKIPGIRPPSWESVAGTRVIKA